MVTGAGTLTAAALSAVNKSLRPGRGPYCVYISLLYSAVNFTISALSCSSADGSVCAAHHLRFVASLAKGRGGVTIETTERELERIGVDTGS